MERRIESDVEGWPTRPFEDGYDGLRQLASADFSGVVRAGGTWLFFVNGKIVGVFEGELEDVEDAQGTAHKAPHPSLPLLYAMQVTGGDTRAKYYTNDTPISEVHETLSSGSFTGYVELSENVLSGDYYQLYHGGASMSVAFVGNSGKMITGDDAFERADDEVGIYEVVDVDFEVTEVPEPEPAESSDSADSSDSTGSTDSADAVDAAGAAAVGAADGDAAADQPAAGDAGGDVTDDAAATDEASSTATRSEAANSESAHTEAAGSDAASSNATRSDAADSPDDGASASRSDGPDDPNGADTAGSSPDSPPSTSSGATPAPPATDADVADSPEAEPTRDADASDDATETPDAETPGASNESGDETRARAPGSRAERERSAATEDDASSPGAETTAPLSRGSATDGTGSRTAGTDSGRGSDAAGQSPSASPDAGSPRGDDPQRSESAWREATTVPSLDPENSDEPEPPVATQSTGSEGRTRSAQQSKARSDANAQSRSQRQSRSNQQRGTAQQSGSAQESSAAGQRGATNAQSSTGRSGDVDDTLEQEVLEREDRIDRLQQRVENLEEDRDEIADERDRLSERVDSLTEENESLRGEIRSLEEEIEELEAAAERAEAAGGAGDAASGSGGSAGGAMTPRAALEGTDLFVRYDSKSAPTLEAAHDGSADAGEVNQNLRLDVHTQFENEGTTVEGEPFEAFLEETMAYRFVEWLVRTLPYEIRETDSASELRDLYDALPEVDRVEFHGEVARDTVDDEEGAPSETFDVVVRDKMGEALFVANMNDARDPATGRMIVDLQEAASRVKEHSMALSSAFFVTRSFFEPAALETASEATSGSLLSRDSRKSYVKLSRKQGYHLCLVEARGDDLHLNAPEL